MGIYLGTTPLTGTVGQRNIGQVIQSTIPLTDAGLHLLDGSVISGSGAYSAFVTHIAGLVSSYPDLFTTEANWQQSITDYGVCGKFVYDSVNNTVRLPKITGFTEGTIDPTVLGDLVEAGLPNITADWNSAQYSGGWDSNGAVYGVANSSKEYNSGSDGMRAYFDASRSNSIYGNSSTVQPQAIKVLYYIVIATTTKTNIQVDIDEVMTDLNGKVDIADLGNCEVVVETYRNGTSWYRVYSDGWCEQGFCYSPPSSSAQTINLLKEYKDTNYTVQTTYNTGSDWANPLYVYNKTVNNFILTTKSTWNTSTVIAISVCGYIS